MTRPRKRGQKDLPANLYQAGGRFRYRHPATGKYHGMGRDRAAAIAAARKLNQVLEEEQADLVNQVLGGGRDVERVLDRYEAEYLPTKQLKASTLEIRQGAIRQVREAFKGRALDDLTVHDLADYLNARQGDAYLKHRTLLRDIFRWAGSQGLVESNPAELTLAKKPEEKKRRRLTLEQFDAIRANAPTWLQLAMDLALLTLQARNEIAAMRFDHVEEDQDGTRHLRVVREKTKDQTERAYIRIAVGPALEALLSRARRTGVLSPMVVHYKPERRKRNQVDAKEHWTAVTPDYITKQFKKVRDGLEAFQEMPAGERPTFHEIRSLGAHLYEEAGQPVEYVNALLGHTSEKMTRHYQDGHAIRWTEAAAELDLDALLGR